ncbi:MAG: hypothetical protein AB7S26_23530 [Sandaracinaceae bacterium]
MWNAQREPITGGLSMRLLEGDRALSFRAVFAALEADPAFADWYTARIAEVPFDGLFWEHPALTPARFDNPYELALIDGPALAGFDADRAPFAAHFAASDGPVVSFDNLGGDAHLIVPRPIDPDGPDDAYAHLAAFVRRAPPAQVRSFWHHIGRSVTQRLRPAALYVSTAGLGVAWLHARLDDRPKYYRHTPYRRAQ